MPTRDWAGAAQNAAMLGLAATGVAFPLAPAFGLYRSLRPKKDPKAKEAEDFVNRFVEHIGAWCAEHEAEIHASGGMPSAWREEFVERLGTAPPSDAAGAQQLLLTTLFRPEFETLRERQEAVVRALAADMPKLIVKAGDPYNVFGALVSLLEGNFGHVESLLKGLDPDQPHAVDPALVAAYLSKLRHSLNIDNWSARASEDGKAVTLDDIQQRLSLTETDPKTGRRADPAAVDELAERCERLVVLGGPGTGKSWTARRAAIRAAEAALDRLDADGSLDEIEIPLFAACSQVLEKSDRPRWERLIDATLECAPTDPGHVPRLRHLLRSHERVFIVLDGLDEAASPQNDALTQLIGVRPAGTIRLLLTSRPGSWNSGLLPLDAANDRHRQGELDPFTHDDVCSVVRAWLADVPITRDRLLQRLQDPNSALSRQAQVPLLCAMFCLVARPDPDTSDDPFDLFEPGRRLDLFDDVIRKLLFATWRDNSKAPSDEVAANATAWLERLAEAGNKSDDVTGLGKWQNEFQPRGDPPACTAPYVSHVAPPSRRRRPDDRERRLFIHRSLREHLAAKALHRRDPADLAAELLPHLWFDSDWAEVIPAVLAGHPQADELVTELARLVEQAIPDDPYHALDRTLVKTAALTSPDSATNPVLTDAIDRALTATADRTSALEWGEVLGATSHWPATAAACDRLIGLFTLWWRRVSSRPAEHTVDPAEAERIEDHPPYVIPEPPVTDTPKLAESLARLGPPPERAARACDLLIVILDSLTPRDAEWLAPAFTALGPTPEQAAQACDVLLRWLAEEVPWVDASDAADLAEGLARLGPTPEQAAHARDRFLNWLTDPGLGADDAATLAEALARLGPTPEQAAQACDRLVSPLTDPALHADDAATLAEGLARLGPTPEQAAQACDRLVSLFAAGHGDRDLAKSLAGLDPTPEQTAVARETLVNRLNQPDLRPYAADSLVAGLAALGPTPEQTACVCDRILDLTSHPYFHPATAGEGWERGAVMAALLRAGDLAESLAALSLTPEQAARASHQLLGLLNDPDPDPFYAGFLADKASKLGPPPEEAARACDRILDILNNSHDAPDRLGRCAAGLTGLGPTPDQAALVRDQLLDLLNHPDLETGEAGRIAVFLARVGPIGNVGWISRTALMNSRVGDLLRRSLPFTRWAEVLAHSSTRSKRQAGPRRQQQQAAQTREPGT